MKQLSLILGRQDERTCEIKDKSKHVHDQGPGSVVQMVKDTGEESGVVQGACLAVGPEASLGG